MRGGAEGEEEGRGGKGGGELGAFLGSVERVTYHCDAKERSVGGRWVDFVEGVKWG